MRTASGGRQPPDHAINQRADAPRSPPRRWEPYTDAMIYLKIVPLALIQGMAELLPVSSTAHVIVAEMLMGIDPSDPELTFLLVMLHTGTMFAVLFYFWPRWSALLRSSTKSDAVTGGMERRFHFI